MTFSASLPDADRDGIENSLDPCPFDDGLDVILEFMVDHEQIKVEDGTYSRA